MEIVVGSTSHASQTRSKNAEGGNGGFTEARMLNIRSTRRGTGMPPVGNQDRRRGGYDNDPISGRVLMLMVPDSAHLPKDFHAGQYRVFIRFAAK